MKTLYSLPGLAAASLAALWLAAPAAPAAAQGPVLGDQLLSIGIPRGLMTNVPKNVVAEMARHLTASSSTDDVACPRSFTILSITTTDHPTVVQNEQQLRRVEAYPQYVHVVAELDWCGKMGEFEGCSVLGGEEFTVSVFGDTGREGTAWAHEFGHTIGLRDLEKDPTTMQFPRPRALMNAKLSRPGEPLHDQLNPQECLAFSSTPKNPVPPKGPLVGPGGAPAASAPPRRDGAESLSQDDPSAAPLEEFVRARYIHGFPIGRARHFGPAAVPVLLRLLSDSREAAHAGNAAAALGVVGGPAEVTPLIAFVRRLQRSAATARERRPLTSAMLALGHLAQRTRSAEALRFLSTASDPEFWRAGDAAGPSGVAANEQAERMAHRARMGLAVSGDADARAALEGWARQVSAAGGVAADAAAETAEMLMDAHEQVRRAGLAGYYEWSR